MKSKNKLKTLLTLITITIICFFGFIYFSAVDNISFSSLNSKNSFYKSVRYRLLTDLFRTYHPENYNDSIPVIDIRFDDEDIKHLVNLQEKIPTQKEFKNTKEQYYDYSKINQWKYSKFFFKGDSCEIKWKSHGREPIYLHSDGKRYLSLNIKLNNGVNFNGSNHFRLIVHKKLGANMKVNEYMANHFNLIYRKHRLFKVTQNGDYPRLYWFEDRYNNKFTKKIHKKSLVIFSKKEEKSHVITSDTNIFEIANSLQKLLKKKQYNQKVSDTILYYYKNINRLLINNVYDSINDFFDEDYITSFMAARMIGGCDGHGMEKRNFYMYFDTTTYKFFPCLTREEQYSRYKSSDSIEYYFPGHYLINKNYSFFNNTLFQNDKLRQEAYKKTYNFIRTNKNQFIEDIDSIMHSDESRYFPKWVRSSQGLEHLYTLPYFSTNLDSIDKHLSIARPTITTEISNNKLHIEFRPNSFSGLVFKELKIKCNNPSLKLSVSIKIADNSEEIKLGSLQANKLGIISIENLLSKFQFYDKLDNRLISQKTVYIITLEAKDKVEFHDNISFQIKNLVTNEKIK